MKRIWRVIPVFFILAVLVFGLAGAAEAAEKTDPYRQQMLQGIREKQKVMEEVRARRKTGPAANGDSDYVYVDGPIDFACTGTKAPTKTLTFTATLTDGSDPADYDFLWYITDEERDQGGVLFVTHENTGRTQISYKFYSAGSYSAYVSIKHKDSGGSQLGFAVMEFDIADDGVNPTMEEAAEEIVDNCRGATKWDTALNLYDWLTENAYYDDSREYHGPDILFMHYGVCDSFSKAYALLLNTAGIPADRAFGLNHAWNTLQLGGDWYQADPTWDCGGSYMPGEGTEKDGWEGHDFFCVNAAAMKQIRSHTYEDGTQGGEHAAECVSMEENYYIHTGEWMDFGDYYYDETTYEYGWKTVPEQIQAALNAGTASGALEVWVRSGDGGASGFSGYQSILEEIMKCGLGKTEFLIGADRVRIKAEMTSTVNMNFRLAGWDIQETGTLTLPKSMTAVPAEGFAGSRATTLVIQPGCKTVGAGAFRNSGVRTVTLPASVTKIAADAFDGCGKLIFITDSPAAAEYAEGKGILVTEP